ncbi:heme peroxidase [Mesorhizobium sp. 131-3-5]|uniref:peroxidase family protein n=1 Tax=Mesorhizobium sp. 131-3-5 TaxID=2744520 RepID=UPI0019271DE3|nr:heme peroxidase family protein [Mesorhizobium sp. 131-3-5]BCH07845.1 heme peroxidase [Mesorhizobium sp. 131-3-5]
MAAHGTPPRGIDATRSPLFEGRFGRMFRNLAPATFGANDQDNRRNLKALGAAMSADIDEPKDGLDAEESGIPALYTYFGQFVDHDITFDPVSTLRKSLDPDGLVDFRTPSFNLDNVYGRGPADQPYMYTKEGRFRHGDAMTGAGGQSGHDLPRFAGRAIIGDPRNDENSLVSQLQGLMLNVHNRMVDDNPGLGFEALQQLVRFHYQYVVVNDFLSRIVSQPILDALKTDGRFDQKRLRYFHWRNLPFMPVEFSVAAYRLGHSMVRPGYRLNDDKLLPIFPRAGKPHEEALTGFQTMKPGRALDWGRFIDIDKRAGGSDPETGDPANVRRLQFAYRIDTSLVGFLHDLPKAVAGDPPASLGERNLLRGWLLGLPSGQSVARAMAIEPLADADIIIGKAVDAPEDGDVVGPIIDAVTAKGGDGKAFADNCPLWTYVLAEAATNKTNMAIPITGGGTRSTPQLGPVGGHIVAEVFLGLLFGDGMSYLSLDPLWKPVSGAGFRLKDLVSYGLGMGPSLHYR